MTSSLHTHTYFVPLGYTDEDAWQEIQAFGRIRARRFLVWLGIGHWTNRVCDGQCRPR